MRVLAIVLALPLAVQAQGSLDLPNQITGPEALASAAQAVLDAGQDKLLVADLIGLKVKGPDGSAVGTVENLAALPGGRLVAALMTLPDGTRIAVPYQALKVTGAAGALEATLPVAADELAGMPALKELAASLDGG